MSGPDQSMVLSEAKNSPPRGKRSSGESRFYSGPRRFVVNVLVGSLLLIAGCWVGSQYMATPAQLAASALPPAASVITMPVELRTVSSQVVTRGTVVAPEESELLAGRVMKGASAAVVTRLPVANGGEILPGTVAIEISGRPVFAMKGIFPAYRDLGEGSAGPDVKQLQAALAEIGLSSAPDPDASFMSGTASALSKLYVNSGYAPQPSLPASEVAFMSGFPARALSSSIQVGADATSSSFKVASGALEVVVTTDKQLDAVAREGVAVKIDSESLGATAHGKVGATARDQSVAAAPEVSATAAPSATSSAGSAATKVTVVPDAPLAAEWAGQDVRVTITQASSDGEVLAVPVSAVYQGADGVTKVTVLTGTGTDSKRKTVPVSSGVTGDGYVEIAPKTGGTLSEGDLVVVGKA